MPYCGRTGQECTRTSIIKVPSPARCLHQFDARCTLCIRRSYRLLRPLHAKSGRHKQNTAAGRERRPAGEIRAVHPAIARQSSGEGGSDMVRMGSRHNHDTQAAPSRLGAQAGATMPGGYAQLRPRTSANLAHSPSGPARRATLTDDGGAYSAPDAAHGDIPRPARRATLTTDGPRDGSRDHHPEAPAQRRPAPGDDAHGSHLPAHPSGHLPSHASSQLPSHASGQLPSHASGAAHAPSGARHGLRACASSQRPRMNIDRHVWQGKELGAYDHKRDPDGIWDDVAGNTSFRQSQGRCALPGSLRLSCSLPVPSAFAAPFP